MTTANLTLADNDTVIQYTATGGETEFEFDFPILDAAELAVSVDQVDQVLGTDYTVTGEGAAAGGTVTFTSARTAGEVITLWLDMDIKRLTGFSTGAAVLTGSALNTEFARQVRHDQMLRRDIRRSLRLAPDDPQSGQDMEIPTQADRAGKFLAFDASGVPTVATVTGSEDASLRSDLASAAASVGYQLVAITPTTEETNAGVTIVKKHLDRDDPARYGLDPDATGTTNHNAIMDALNANERIRFRRYGTGLYKIAEPIVVPGYGHEIYGPGPRSTVSETEPRGITLQADTGWPSSGGAAAQAMIVPSRRFFRLEGLTLDCASLALHGIFGNGGQAGAWAQYSRLFINMATGDAVLMRDATWMNLFHQVRAEQPGGYGFNIDTDTGNGNTTTQFAACYVNGSNGALGGWRFDKALSAVLDACAADNLVGSAPVLTVVGASTVTANQLHCEISNRLLDMTTSTSSCTLIGGLFNGLGNDATPPDDVINVAGGHLTVIGARFENDEASTVFADLGTDARVDWSNNTFDLLIDKTNTLTGNVRVRTDNKLITQGSFASTNRYEIEGSGAKLSLFDKNGTTDQRRVALFLDGGIAELRGENDAYALTKTGFAWNLSTDVYALRGLPVHTDNAAALSAGLSAGQLYKTAAGAVHQVTAA